jgi:hypothetical protein
MKHNRAAANRDCSKTVCYVRMEAAKGGRKRMQNWEESNPNWPDYTAYKETFLLKSSVGFENVANLW